MKVRPVAAVALSFLLAAAPAFAVAVDPGPRGGAPAAGGALSTVAANNPATILTFFNDAKTRFQEVASVSGTIPGETGFGLGPRFNSRSCAACHAQPAVGGSSPSVNPQIADADADGASNLLPSFISSSTAVKEARFTFFTDAAGNPITTSPDGGVHALFTIADRTDSLFCSSSVISQPNFFAAVTNNNVTFRIPTPLFGAGLIENIDESDLLAGLGAGGLYGVAGTFNHNPNDGTIARFGWKAQNKSLEIFSSEAYNVEMGVSNEGFPQERPSPDEDRASGLDSRCRFNPTPEDHTNFNTTAVGTPSDAVQFAMFMRLLAPPGQANSPGGLTSIINGEATFTDIGCAACHHVSFNTAASSITPDLDNKTAKLWSDLQIHHMGTGLADNVQQGDAGGDQFRTAPLWGLGQRLFFLHDGRTTNLISAITAHSSTGSEANTVVANWGLLSVSQQQDVLNFLRSL